MHLMQMSVTRYPNVRTSNVQRTFKFRGFDVVGLEVVTYLEM